MTGLSAPGAPMLVDTHAHLCDVVFDADRAAVVARAAAAGIGAVVAVGETLADARRNLELSVRHPLIRPAAGLYPTLLDPQSAEEMALFIRRERHRLVAVGEVGLDFWAVKDASARSAQEEIFKSFIGLARELDLPLNVHSRSAGRRVIELLLQNGACRVQLHAFDGKASTALAGVEAGFFFSIPTSVVRSRQKQKLVKQLPLANLLVETDSPVLGPDPKLRNEPANLLLSIKAIAEIKRISEDEVMSAVSANSAALYSFDKAVFQYTYNYPGE